MNDYRKHPFSYSPVESASYNRRPKNTSLFNDYDWNTARPGEDVANNLSTSRQSGSTFIVPTESLTPDNDLYSSLSGHLNYQQDKGCDAKMPTSTFSEENQPSVNANKKSILQSSAVISRNYSSPEFQSRSDSIRSVLKSVNTLQFYDIPEEEMAEARYSLQRKQFPMERNNCALLDYAMGGGINDSPLHDPATNSSATNEIQSGNKKHKPKHVELSEDENEHLEMRKADYEFICLIQHHLNCDKSLRAEFMKYCQGDHLASTSLLGVSPEESNVQCYVDLHGHCTRRGCFCYGNCLKNDKHMIDNVLFARLVTVNSSFFDFGGCNFSMKNMYSRDRSTDQTKEGSGRVAIGKHTGLVHCYTVEANYNSGRLVNILSPTVLDNRSATPPGHLWGSLRNETIGLKQDVSSCFLNMQNVVRPVMLMDYGSYVMNTSQSFGPSHFEEMGRGLLLAGLDMWCHNPWSRLSTHPCADLLKYKPGTHRTLRNLTTPAPCPSGNLSVSKHLQVYNRVRQTELTNLKLLRCWAYRFVNNLATHEGITLLHNEIINQTTSNGFIKQSTRINPTPDVGKAKTTPSLPPFKLTEKNIRVFTRTTTPKVCKPSVTIPCRRAISENDSIYELSSSLKVSSTKKSMRGSHQSQQSPRFRRTSLQEQRCVKAAMTKEQFRKSLQLHSSTNDLNYQAEFVYISPMADQNTSSDCTFELHSRVNNNLQSQFRNENSKLLKSTLTNSQRDLLIKHRTIDRKRSNLQCEDEPPSARVIYNRVRKTKMTKPKLNDNYSTMKKKRTLSQNTINTSYSGIPRKSSNLCTFRPEGLNTYSSTINSKRNTPKSIPRKRCSSANEKSIKNQNPYLSHMNTKLGQIFPKKIASKSTPKRTPHDQMSKSLNFCTAMCESRIPKDPRSQSAKTLKNTPRRMNNQSLGAQRPVIPNSRISRLYTNNACSDVGFQSKNQLNVSNKSELRVRNCRSMVVKKVPMKHDVSENVKRKIVKKDSNQISLSFTTRRSPQFPQINTSKTCFKKSKLKSLWPDIC